VPSIGLLGRYVDGGNAWSGIPSGLARGIDDHEFAVLRLSAESPDRLTHLARRWLSTTRRLDRSWEQTPEMMLLRNATVRWRLRHLHGQPLGWIQMGSEFGKPLRAPYVTLEDMTVAQAVSLPSYVGGPLSPRVARHWIRRQRRIYDGAVACCVASHWAGDSLVRDYGIPAAKVHVVGLGCNLVVQPAARDWSQPRFLFIGMDWERKNGAAMVRAFERLRQDLPRATLDVVGNHPRLDAPHVTGHGVLRRDDAADRAVLTALLGSSTCFVMPSTYEPFGIAYAEAGLAGLPSIATSVGGARDAVGSPGGLFVAPDQPRELLEAMRTLCEPQLAKQLGEGSQRNAQLLSWPLVAGRILGALGLITDEQRPSDLGSGPI
jgi:glycosyltransferase involved in cell wall biosynthesis